MKALCAALLLSALSLCGAEPLAFSFMADQPAAPGGKAAVKLIVLNTGQQEASLTPPATLAAELTIGDQSWPIELHRSPASDAPTERGLHMTPGGFSAHAYTFAVPAGASGRAVIATGNDAPLAAQGALTLASSLAGPATGEAAAPSPSRRPATEFARAEPAAGALQRTFADRMGPHEPVYFIYGPDAPAAKFQFSFKYKLLDFSDPADTSRARTLQFAFTQRSLWDLEGVSSPFYDTSYMPELIFESLAPAPENTARWFTWLGFQAAFKHESNGRDGPVSRSLNTLYVRPVLAIGRLGGWHLLVMPELHTYLDNLEDNSELKDYRGYGQLRLVLGRNDGPSLMATLWAGKDFERQSVQLDLTVPLKTRLLDFRTYLLVQYFNGYGESLLSYREQSETVRAGLSIVR